MDKHTKSCLPDGWEVVVARDLTGVESLRPVWEKLRQNEAFPVPNADIDRFISVVEPMQDAVRPHIILLRHNGNPKAMVISRVEKTILNCKIGYKTLLKPSLRCLSVVYEGLFGDLTDDIRDMLMQELMDTLGKGEAEVVFFNHLRTDSAMYQLATRRGGLLCRGRLSKIEIHRSMSVPDRIDSFYKSRSKRHRGNLRRYIRNLEEEYANQVRIISYRREAEVEEFITAASQISSQTYQDKLGSSFVDNEQTKKLIETAARCGWLRAHVLYVGDEPCAFQCALHYKRIYFLEQIGFNTKWRQYNAGTVLFLKVLEELCEGRETETIDFGFGDADYKRSYGNMRWQEASVYIFAPRLYPIFVNMLRTSVMGLNTGLEYILNRTGFAGWVKRHWRNLLRKQKKN